MSKFSEYLRQLIQSRNLSIAKLSRESGVERTSIHKALAGERILQYQALDTLALYLELTPTESRKLRQYFSQLFESENTRHAREIIDRIFIKLADMPRFLSDRQQWFQELAVPNFVQKKNIYKGSREISGLIRAVIAEAVKHGNPKLKLAVPPGTGGIGECIERLCGEGVSMEITHIICLDAAGKDGEYSLQNLEYLGFVLPGCILSHGQYQVYYYYNDRFRARYTDPFPYFMVAQSGVVCFSENGQTAVYMGEKEQVEYFSSHFFRLRELCHKLVCYGDEVWEGEAGRAQKHCFVMSQPYLKGVGLERSTILFTRKGVSEFLSMGRMYDFAAGTEEAVAAEKRGEMLGAFLEAVENDCIRGRMMNEVNFSFPDHLALSVVTGIGMSLHDREGKWKIRIRERNICRAFYDWGIHISESDSVFSKAKTLEIFGGMFQK